MSGGEKTEADWQGQKKDAVALQGTGHCLVDIRSEGLYILYEQFAIRNCGEQHESPDYQ